jgi:hypothetical protein
LLENPACCVHLLFVQQSDPNQAGLDEVKTINFIKEKKRSLSFPLIIDDLFNDISIRENLKRKYSENEIFSKSKITKEIFRSVRINRFDFAFILKRKDK